MSIKRIAEIICIHDPKWGLASEIEAWHYGAAKQINEEMSETPSYSASEQGEGLREAVDTFYGWLKIRRQDLHDKIVNGEEHLKPKKDMLDEIIGNAYKLSPNYHPTPDEAAEK